MDIAKSAVVEQPQISSVTPSNGITTYDYDGVPIDIIRFFNTDMSRMNTKEKDELLTISKWAFKDVETLGDGLMKLRNLEIKLGRPLGDPESNRRMKIYNWVRIQQHIEDLGKRQEALRG
jgi:predicted porin